MITDEPNPLRFAIDAITGQAIDEAVDLIQKRLGPPDLKPEDVHPGLLAAVMSTRLEAMRATGTLAIHFRDLMARSTQPEHKGGGQ